MEFEEYVEYHQLRQLFLSLLEECYFQQVQDPRQFIAEKLAKQSTLSNTIETIDLKSDWNDSESLSEGSSAAGNQSHTISDANQSKLKGPIEGANGTSVDLLSDSLAITIESTTATTSTTSSVKLETLESIVNDNKSSSHSMEPPILVPDLPKKKRVSDEAEQKERTPSSPKRFKSLSSSPSPLLITISSPNSEKSRSRQTKDKKLSCRSTEPVSKITISSSSSASSSSPVSSSSPFSSPGFSPTSTSSTYADSSLFDDSSLSGQSSKSSSSLKHGRRQAAVSSTTTTSTDAESPVYAESSDLKSSPQMKPRVKRPRNWRERKTFINISSSDDG